LKEKRVASKPVVKRVALRKIRCGRNVTIIEPCNLYDCFLDDDCFVGPFVEIQRGVRIGKRSRVQSHAFICEMVEIGQDCFVSHGAVFINDRFESGKPARGDRSRYRMTKIGNHVSIGSNATILPVSICDRVVIGAGAVVTSDIVVPGIYAGNPAKKIRSL
jgi:acetyltransferase-like isoleucine patch superfamily enzyme